MTGTSGTTGQSTASVLEGVSLRSQDVRPPATAGPYVPSMQAEMAVVGPGEVQWQLAYDRESIDRFSAEVAAARARLVAEIEVARARAQAAAGDAEHRRHLAARAELGELVVAAHAELEQIEREHRELVAAIRATAEAEAARVLAAAQAEVAAVRAAAASMAVLVHGDGSMPNGSRTPTAAHEADHSGIQARFDAG